MQWGWCPSAPSSFLTVSCAGREAACDEILGERRGNSTEVPWPSLRHVLCPGEKSTSQV